MLATIKQFFQTQKLDDGAQTDEQQKRLACAALLIEVAIIDQEFDANELKVMLKVLRKKFDLSREECEKLVSLAQLECENASSTYQFTHLVNQHCNHDEKFSLLQGMWSIAYTDGDLDKYEEYTIRKVADLIHMAHGDFIRAKHLAREAIGSN